MVWWPEDSHETYLFTGTIFFALVGTTLCFTGFGFTFGLSFLSLSAGHALKYAAEKTVNQKQHNLLLSLSAIAFFISMAFSVVGAVNLFLDFMTPGALFQASMGSVAKVWTAIAAGAYCLATLSGMGKIFNYHNLAKARRRQAGTARRHADSLSRLHQSPLLGEVRQNLPASSSTFSHRPSGSGGPSLPGFFSSAASAARSRQLPTLSERTRPKPVLVFEAVDACYWKAIDYLALLVQDEGRAGALTETDREVLIDLLARRDDYVSYITQQLIHEPTELKQHIEKGQEAGAFACKHPWLDYTTFATIQNTHPTTREVFKETDLVYNRGLDRALREFVVRMIQFARHYEFRDAEAERAGCFDEAKQQAFIAEVDTLHPAAFARFEATVGALWVDADVARSAPLHRTEPTAPRWSVVNA